MKMVYNGPMPILLAPLEPLADSYHEKNSFWPQAIMGIVRKISNITIWLTSYNLLWAARYTHHRGPP